MSELRIAAIDLVSVGGPELTRFLATLLEEMLAETGGPLTDSERRAADRALERPGSSAE